MPTRKNFTDQLRRYGAAVVAVFLAWLVRYFLHMSLQDHAVYVTFVGAVLITTWLSGLGPGLLALTLSVLIVTFAFLPLVNGLHIGSPTEALGLALFVVVTTICIGVTEALRAMHEARAAELRLSDERFRHLIEAMPSIVWTASPEGKITYANDKWLAFCGITRTEADRGWPELTLHPEDRERCLEAWARSLREGTEYEIETRNQRQDGVYRWFMTRAVPWKSVSGTVLAWFGITTDIHEQKEMQERLHENDRRKDEFLATLAHELRNPLAPLRNSLEVMRRASERGLATDGPREIMERQLTQMVHLVDDLLDLSRITRGRIELRIARLDLADAVHDALETCRPQIEQRKHRLQVDLPEEPLFVDGDRVRLAQILTNLLNNAAKYSPPESDLGVRVERAGKEALVRVKDSGIGIEPALLPHIFDMFSQAVRSQELTEGGLGIGLSLVRGLVEQHGGTVEARSEGTGKGSEFTVRLPLASAAVRPEAAPHDDGVQPRVRRRVLVADDNRDSADSLAAMLSLMGHEAETAYDGTDALEKAAAYRPDVIVLDLGMPRLDGYEAARRIRSEPWSNGVKLVALTGWGQEEDRARAKRAGFDHHITKPASLEALIRVLDGAPAKV